MSNRDELRKLIKTKINDLTSQVFTIDKRVSSVDIPFGIYDGECREYMLDRLEQDIKYNTELLEVINA